MPIDLTSGIVQILRNDNVTVGTGFLVSESGLIATCAHVVQAAKVGPGGKLTVCFQKNGEKSNALVIQEWWRSPDNEDIAILKLESQIPEGVKVLPLGGSEGIEDHKVKTFGFPSLGSIHGLWGKGTLYGKVTEKGNTLLQIDSKEITSGFSGAPLCDKSRNRVIGIIVSIAKKDSFDKLQDTAFAIPSEILRLICPELEIKDICPYRGLFSFKEEDQEFFFGRDKLVQELIDKLRSSPRFLAAVGSSGRGKSSVVSAGLLPRIRRGDVSGFENALIVTLRPGIKPNESLKKALSSVLRIKEHDFWDKVRSYLQKEGDKRLVIFVDQFEELFTISEEYERNEFIENLVNLLESGLKVSLIITIRADFYEFLINSKFEKFLSKGQVNITPMSKEELKDAIKKPAKAVGLEIETGLEDSLIKDLKNTEDPLPLLEFTLTKLWEHRSDGQLTHKSYRKLGGVTGAIGQWAGEAYDKLGDEEKKLSRRIFTRLIHYGESGTRDSRRRLSLAELTAESEDKDTIHKLITKLADAHLLVTDRESITGTETVEIIHDSLIAKWDTLNEWIEEHRNFLLWRQRLDTKVNEWNTGKDEGSLLRGAVLSEAEEWKEKRGQELNQSEKNYIQKSLEVKVKEKRKRKLFIQGLSIFSILTLLLAGVAVQQSALAEEGRKESLARYLVYKSEDLEKEPANLDTSALLAIESYRIDKTGEADRLIHNVLSLRHNVIFMKHDDSVTSVAFSPDGQYIATASIDNTARLWNATTGREIFTMEHDNFVDDVSFSPDGKYIATVSDESASLWNSNTGEKIYTLGDDELVTIIGTPSVIFSPDGKYILTAGLNNKARLWDVATGEELFTLKHDDFVNGVAFSPDGGHIATASDNNTARLWDVTTGKETFVMEHSGWSVESVAFSPDGQYIATAGDDNTARLWDAVTGEEIFTMKHDDSVTSVAFSPDGQYIATASIDNTARLWDAVTGDEIFIMNHDGPVANVAFSDNGKYVATASSDKTARLWSVDTGEEIFVMGHNEAVNDVVFSPDGEFIATASEDSSAGLWTIDTEEQTTSAMEHDDFVNDVAFSPDGKYVATASNDNTTRLWDVATGKQVLAPLKHDGLVSNVVFSPDGKYVATASDDNTARLWDAAIGKRLFVLNHDGWVNDVVFSPDGKYIATAGDTTAHLWDVTTGKEIFSMEHDGSVDDVAFSPDGKFIVTAFVGGACLWNINTGKEVFYIESNCSVSGVEFSPDGKYLAMANADSTARLWNVFTRKEIFVMNHNGPVDRVAFSPDGKYIATASWDTTARVWNAVTGEETFVMERDDYVNDVAFSPDGRYVATASSDNTARLWDAATGKEIYIMKHDNWVNKVAFSPDGKYIATASNDGTTKLWEYNTEDIIHKIGTVLPRNLNREEWERYMGNEPYHKTFQNLP